MVKGLIALCMVAAVQVCTAYELAVPVFKQPYGLGESRIVGGQEAAKGQFPYQAGVYLDGSAFCGGSLISKNWVLTAGHCVDGFRQWTVILGAHKIRDSSEPGRVSIDSSKGIKHESYDDETITNDVAVIQLPKDVTLSDTIKAIALPPKSLKNQDLSGKKVRVSGWGRVSDSSSGISPTLQFVDLNLITRKECQTVFGDIITETKYCCSGANQKSTCNGDSGGSLTIGEGADLVNLGIVSFGSSRGCAKGYPVGFTATPHFVEWVSNKTGIPIKE